MLNFFIARKWDFRLCRVIDSIFVVGCFQGVRNATKFRATCVQAGRNTSDPYGPPPSEDCLHLNIWTPSVSPPENIPAPVLFWIHGGALRFGSGSDRWYNGARLAATAGVVVVTVNYRLGPLGFLVTTTQKNATGGNGGMNGYRDIVTALQWVQTHIGSFGGDKLRVTVFGESAGSIATCSLAVSPRAAGLFQVWAPQ